MPAGVNVEVDGGWASISFPDKTKRGPGLKALLDTDAIIDVRTGGPLKTYVVPEGNAREAGLLDEPRAPKLAAASSAPQTAPEPTVEPTPTTGEPPTAEPVAATPPAAKKAAAKKAPAKKAAPAAPSKEASDGGS